MLLNDSQELAVLAFFRRRSAVRAWVAIAASHAFVLQLLLTGIVATQMTIGASADPFVICSSDTGSPDGSHGGSGPHAGHQACAICTLAFSAPLLAATGQPIVLAIEAVAIFPPATMPSAVAHGWHNPRSSQGPPQNV
jgi:hypothetical protein